MKIIATISSHPDVQGSVAENLIAAVEAAYDCAKICVSCADACVAEDMDMRQCIRLCLDCADVCFATATIASRRTGSNEALIAQMLAVCETACHLCGNECQGHAGAHDHCRLCAEAFLACAEACQRAVSDVT
jgi:hypothetical protein